MVFIQSLKINKIFHLGYFVALKLDMSDKFLIKFSQIIKDGENSII